MQVVYHEDFLQVYAADPASAPGRIEAVLREIRDFVTFVEAVPAADEDIGHVHTKAHVNSVRREGIYDIAALAAGGAIQAARLGMEKPAFALIRPPGHHASAGSAWGFCYFNNMAIALERLRRDGLIKTALVLDFDLHFGDGTVNIFQGRDYVTIYNPSSANRATYLQGVKNHLQAQRVDIIGVSAGFDNHEEDWGGLLTTRDYEDMGRWVREATEKNKGGAFGILEGGYNHRVLGKNVRAFLEGLSP